MNIGEADTLAKQFLDRVLQSKIVRRTEEASAQQDKQSTEAEVARLRVILGPLSKTITNLKYTLQRCAEKDEGYLLFREVHDGDRRMISERAMQVVITPEFEDKVKVALDSVRAACTQCMSELHIQDLSLP